MATILCIDDDANFSKLYPALLESIGHKVITAADGPSGIAISRERAIDLVVLDFNMPGMDGNQVAEVLRKEHPALPVILCSGCLEEIPASLRWFADAVLHKGDGPEVLLSTIERILRSSSTRVGPSSRMVPTSAGLPRPRVWTA